MTTLPSRSQLRKQCNTPRNTNMKSRAYFTLAIVMAVPTLCMAWMTNIGYLPQRLPTGLQGKSNFRSFATNRCFSTQPISLQKGDGKFESGEKSSSASLEEITSSYEGTGGFVKGLVSGLTDLVNLVMARTSQVCTKYRSKY
jgi:hypothetical protein